MAEIGSILREARIRSSLSLKQVSEITKIRVKYLEALEQNDFGAVPGPTFIKAYLRTYASVLRLDADGLVEEYRSTYERRKSSQSEYYDLTLEQMRSRNLRTGKRRPVQNTRRGYTVMGVVAIIAVVLLAVFGSRRGPGEAVIDVNSLGGSTTTIAGSITSTTMSGIATTTTSEAVYTGSVVLLRIKATGDCFVVIKETDANGDTLFRGTMTAGDEVTKQEAKRYLVSMGKPEALEVYINDRFYESPAEAGLYYITETRIEPAQ